MNNLSLLRRTIVVTLLVALAATTSACDLSSLAGLLGM
jgi:hypothetical protein